MSDQVRLLEAGGLAEPGADIPADVPVDTVDARIYRHPALPDRAVVRLVSSVIARGTDTELGLLGFQPERVDAGLALRRRQALGFPGRALLEDPERARFALDVMKEFKAQAKRIASKPGHARDGFDEIARRLERSVPHFLPSYWEEVGRAFAGAGNISYAASSFDRARTAEREFGLAVDEEIRGEAFLEFALLGALTVKSLQSYGKELQATVGADAAYERMLSLALRRTLGGLPPWASMLKDLRGLAKAAKRDLAGEERRIVRELLGASAMVRAPRSFWVESRDAIVALCAAEPAVRAKLLDLFPYGGASRWAWRDDDGWSGEWLDLLAEAGALDALWDRSAPTDALPAGGRAAWFLRLQDWARAGEGWTLQLVRRAAPALIADGAPLPLHTGAYYKPLDLDLLEIVLELGVPWRFSDDAVRVDLVQWSQYVDAPERRGFPAEPRRRDPVRAAVEPAVARVLGYAIDQAFGDEHFEAIAHGLSGLRELRRQWLAARVDELTASGLGLTEHALGRLEEESRASHFAEFPACKAALDAVDLVVALERTLRDGIPDELGWPAFDAVIDALAPKKGDDVHVHVQWPHLILGNAQKLFVLGPRGVALEHDVKLGKDIEPRVTAWVGGQLYVGGAGWVRGTGYQNVAYWSGAPADSFTLSGQSYTRESWPLDLPDAQIRGTTRFTRGDRVAVPESGFQAHDHAQSWVWHDGRLHAQDRATGKVGSPSAPGFLSDVADQYPSLWTYAVVPPEIAATSPLGVVDGLYGVKQVRPRPAGPDDDPIDPDDEGVDPSVIRLETLTGDRFVGGLQLGASTLFPNLLVRWPGADRPRPVVDQGSGWRTRHDPHFSIGDASRPLVSLVHDDDRRMSTRCMPPLACWHYLTPRDPAGSAALRALRPGVARALLDGAAAGDDALDAAVAASLPELTDPTLRAGVMLFARLGAAQEARLQKLRAGRADGAVDDRVPGVGDHALTDALSNLRRTWSWGGGVQVTGEIRAIGDWLVRRAPEVQLVDSRLQPREWLGRIRALGWCATRPGLTATQRADLAETLRAWRACGLADPGEVKVSRLRVDVLQPWMASETDDDGDVSPLGDFVVERDGARMVVFDCDTSSEGPWDMTAIEWSSDGRWPSWSGVAVLASRVASTDDGPWLDGLIDALPAQGERSIPPEAVAAVAEATGQTPAEALLALASFPTELDKTLREAHGVKAVEAKGAASAFSDWGVERKLELLAAAAPASPAGFWVADPTAADGATARWIAAWLERVGRVVPVPAELLAAAEKELPGRGGAGRLRQLAELPRWDALHRDWPWQVDTDGDILSSEGPDAFDGSTAVEVLHLLPWVWARLPVGDPLRAKVPEAVALAVARASYPGLLVDAGDWYCGTEGRERKAAEAWFDALGGDAIEHLDEDGDRQSLQKRSGALTATLTSWALKLVFQPSALDAHQRDLVRTYLGAANEAGEQLGAVERIRSDDLRELAERTLRTPVPAGGWEQDARVSAPEVLAAVRAKLDLDEDAGLLYLQLLALPDPTKKNCLLWNDWKPKAYAAAAAVLVERGLVLEGKRARAGREHFLPGGWSEEKQILPYEEWKRPLYGWDGERFALGSPVALAPVHRLFERAWARVEAGDAPRFEEVRR